MRIQLKTDGGAAYFPALAQPRALEDDDLSETDRTRLEALTDAADFFNLPPDMSGAQRGAADYQSYTLTIEMAGKQHTVRFNDLTDDQRLNDLLAFVQAKLRK
ncbi:MAG: protealysin inhibitor emfourin [Anaerolineae bacterium]